MDVQKDNEYMEHCKSEYTSNVENNDPALIQTEEMFDLAKCRGLLS